MDSSKTFCFGHLPSVKWDDLASYPTTRSLQQASFLEKLPDTKAPLPVLTATPNPRGHRLSSPKDSPNPPSYFCMASIQLGVRHQSSLLLVIPVSGNDSWGGLALLSLDESVLSP